MFDKESLRAVAESILSINLLIAILSIIVLYDQRYVNDLEDEENELWKKNVDNQLAELNLRVKKLEEKLNIIFENKI